jgi:cytochrome c peroxidase
MTQSKVELGRQLFYDTRLSRTGDFACASCHQQARAFTDGRARALGATGELHPRGSMSLANVAYAPALGWAEPSLRRLEDQAVIPLLGEEPVELGMGDRVPELLARLRDSPPYPARFSAAFQGDPDPIRLPNVLRALAAFERTLLSGHSPYDQFVYLDEREALGPRARAGMRLFFSERVGCAGCHGGLLFSGPAAIRGGPPVEPRFHNTGLYNLDGRGLYPPGGRGVFERSSRPAEMGRFRAPTLRNVALTAPYMHDGSVGTLREVLVHYAAGGRNLDAEGGSRRPNPHQSERVRGFALSEVEADALIAFLESLTDPKFVRDARFGDPFRTAPRARGVSSRPMLEP